MAYNFRHYFDAPHMSKDTCCPAWCSCHKEEWKPEMPIPSNYGPWYCMSYEIKEHPNGGFRYNAQFTASGDGDLKCPAAPGATIRRQGIPLHAGLEIAGPTTFEVPAKGCAWSRVHVLCQLRKIFGEHEDIKYEW